MMKRIEAELIIASYSVGENPFAALPPSTLVFVRRGLVPKLLMKRICARRALTFLGTKEYLFEDGRDVVYLVVTPAR